MTNAWDMAKHKLVYQRTPTHRGTQVHIRTTISHWTEKGTKTMASKSYFIELIVNFDDRDQKAKEAIIVESAARMAKGLLSTAMLLADRSRPRISMYSSDSFKGNTDIDLNKIKTDGVCPACGHDMGAGSAGDGVEDVGPVHAAGHADGVGDTFADSSGSGSDE